eukprot:5548969-Amphidinium_carterae.1
MNPLMPSRDFAARYPHDKPTVVKQELIEDVVSRQVKWISYYQRARKEGQWHIQRIVAQKGTALYNDEEATSKTDIKGNVDDTISMISHFL